MKKSKAADDAFRTASESIKRSGVTKFRRNLRQRRCVWVGLSGKAHCLQLICYSGECWRWKVDGCCHLKGRNGLLIADDAGETRELTCDKSELATFAEWLPTWFFAFDGGAAFPAIPVPSLDETLPRYMWTNAARQTYQRENGEWVEPPIRLAPPPA